MKISNALHALVARKKGKDLRGAKGTQPPAPIWAPYNSMSPPDWIYKVLFYA